MNGTTEEYIAQLEHDLANARCAAKMAIELVGQCRICGNRTQIIASKAEIERLSGVIGD